MIGTMEAIATKQSKVTGIFEGRVYHLMSEYAPVEMRDDLQVMLNKAECDGRIVVEPQERIRENTGGCRGQELIFSQWVEVGKSAELAEHNARFYQKLEQHNQRERPEEQRENREGAEGEPVDSFFCWIGLHRWKRLPVSHEQKRRYVTGMRRCQRCLRRQVSKHYYSGTLFNWQGFRWID